MTQNVEVLFDKIFELNERLALQGDVIKQVLKDRDATWDKGSRTAEAAQQVENENVQLKDRLEREQKANARLLKTIEEVCRERDDLSRRLSDIVDFVLGGDKPSDEDVEFNPEPGQCWHTINKDYDFIYRWNEDASSILIWRPWKGAWEDSCFKSFTNIEKQYGDLEPVENPENNA